MGVLSEPLTEAAETYVSEPALRRDPTELIKALQQGPALRKTNAGPWLATGYDVVSRLLRDERLSREAAASIEAQAFEEGPARAAILLAVASRDGMAHDRLRRLIIQPFTLRSVLRWRDMVIQITNDLVDRLIDRGEMDIVRDYAYPIPERVISKLLGVPLEDSKKFHDWNDTINAAPVAGLERTGSTAQSIADEAAERTAMMNQFNGYIRNLIDQRRGNYRDDLLSQLMQTEENGDSLSEAELVTMVRDIINGGHHTTASVITNAVFAILKQGGFAAIGTTDEAIQAVALEIMRLHSPVHNVLTRRALEDIEIDGTVISAGDMVMLSVAAANRDPHLYDDPHDFRPNRDKLSRSIAFGGGPHHCAGSHLAKLELQIALKTLSLRLPRLQLAIDAQDVPWFDGPLVIAPSKLPVRW